MVTSITRSGLLLSALFAIAFSRTGVASTTIDTTTNWNGSAVGTWGEPPNTATVGQTFTVGADTRLDYFMFYAEITPSSVPMGNIAYVMQWNPATKEAAGPVLFQSVPFQIASTTLQPMTVETGGIQLTTGQQYVAFFSTSLVNNGNGIGYLGFAGDAYSGGVFVYSFNGTDFSALTTTPWVTDYPSVGGDLAFTMGFDVPEPCSLSLLIGGAGALLRRRSRRLL